MKKQLFLTLLITSVVFLNAAEQNLVTQQAPRIVPTNDLEQIIQDINSQMKKDRFVPALSGILCCISSFSVATTGCSTFSAAGMATGITGSTMGVLQELEVRKIVNSLQELTQNPFLQTPAPQSTAIDNMISMPTERIPVPIEML